jgi:hypothetical protein
MKISDLISRRSLLLAKLAELEDAVGKIAATRPLIAHERKIVLESMLQNRPVTGYIFTTALTNAHFLISRIMNDIRGLSSAKAEPSSGDIAHEIFEDLCALCYEFPKVIWKPGGYLTVITQPIVLTSEDGDDMDLGPMKIELDFEKINILTRGILYRIIPTEPLYSYTGDYFHPHVSENNLCEGEGKLPIKQALRDHRLLDFFMLVRSILNTYNPSSAYMTLDNWRGQPCSDCGEICAENEAYTCEHCGSIVCSHCLVKCPDCRYIYCMECTEECNSCGILVCTECIWSCMECNMPVCSECAQSCCSCEEPFCKGCLIQCERCGDAVCTSCAEGEDKQLCASCAKDLKDEQEEETEEI